ncbi:MAG: SDR family oxidoreductase [Phycisphaerae bacterium]|nr:SDR family oxidoreductase [Phycisphaerae bacterium]
MLDERFNLNGKVALITGSGRGIGLAIGETLSEHGAAVVLHDIELNVAKAAAEKITSRGRKAIAFGGDIEDLSLPKRLVTDAVGAFGGLHILVNNASIQSRESWLDVDVETIHREVNANLISPILFSQLAARIFKPQRFGRIINLGSIQQIRGNPWMLPYSLTKAAMEKLTTAMARDLAKDGITVNLIAPGWMNTHRNREDFPTEERKIEIGKKHVPLGRVGEASDCAGIALLLCSEAGEYITGQSIFVDGGMSTS